MIYRSYISKINTIIKDSELNTRNKSNSGNYVMVVL